MKVYCKLTKELDTIRNEKDSEYVKQFETYLMDPYDPVVKEDYRYIPIRIPGMTVGGIMLGDNDIITEIRINTDWCPYTSPEEAEELVKKYVGSRILKQEEVI